MFISPTSGLRCRWLRGFAQRVLRANETKSLEQEQDIVTLQTETDCLRENMPATTVAD